MASGQGTCYFFYQKGYCKFGNRCKFQHELPPPAPMSYGHHLVHLSTIGDEASIPSHVFGEPSLMGRFAELTLSAYAKNYGPNDSLYSTGGPRYMPSEPGTPVARRSPPTHHHNHNGYGQQPHHYITPMMNPYAKSWAGNGYASALAALAPPPQEKVIKKRIFTPVGTPVLKTFLDEDLAVFKDMFSEAEIGVDPFTRTISITAEATVVDSASKELQTILEERKRLLRHEDRALTSTALGTIRFAVGSGLNVTEFYEPVHFERVHVINFPLAASVESMVATFGAFGNPVEIAVTSVNENHQTKELYVVFERHGEALNAVKGLSQTFLCMAHGIPMCEICHRQPMANMQNARLSTPFMQVHVEVDINRLQRINLFCCANIELGLSDTPDVVPELISDLGLPPALALQKSAEYDPGGRYVVSVRATTARALYASMMVTTSLRGQVPFNITFGALHSLIPIPADLADRLRPLIEPTMEAVAKQYSVDVEWVPDAHFVCVSGGHDRDRLAARGKLKSVFSQSRIPLHPRLVTELKFLHDEIQGWEELSGAYLSVDHEARTACCVGAFDARNAMILLVDNFFSNTKKRLVNRKVSLAPRANECSRVLARRYDEVQGKYNVDITYSYADQSLILVGPNDAVIGAEAMIERMFNSVLDSSADDLSPRKQGPLCVLCSHSVAEGVTLDVCGHTYCVDCLRFVTRTALDAGREVKCAKCDDALLSKEIYRFVSATDAADKCVAHRRALERCLNARAANYCRCLTASCPGVWKKEGSTLVWRCNSCLAAYCWTCKTDYEADEFGMSHSGKTCETYQAARAQSQSARRQSSARDPSCPLCLEPLSKLIGSNLASCGGCAAEVCCSCNSEKSRYECDVGTCRKSADSVTSATILE